jgi:hypothetical protein
MKATNQYSNVSLGDTASIDAMARLRTSNPIDMFSASFLYDAEPFIFESITSGAGATVAHNAALRIVDMAFAASAAASTAILQSYQFMNCQAGRSASLYVAFDFNAIDLTVTKFVGYSDGINGIELRSTAGVMSIALLSSAAATIDTPQSLWNIDPMDGKGPSGIVLDQTKAQVLVIDLQALYAGRARVGFMIGGQVYYVFQASGGNVSTQPGIISLNLPIRMGMTATATATATISMISAGFSVEAGNSLPTYYTFASSTPSIAVASGVATHALSIRPKATFKGFTNRTLFRLQDFSIANTGANSLQWQLCVGQVLTLPSYTDVNTASSAYEQTVVGTLSGSPAVVIATGYAAATNQIKTVSDAQVKLAYPITLNAAGAQRANGQLTLVLTGLGGATTAFCDFVFSEAR